LHPGGARGGERAKSREPAGWCQSGAEGECTLDHAFGTPYLRVPFALPDGPGLAWGARAIRLAFGALDVHFCGVGPEQVRWLEARYRPCGPLNGVQPVQVNLHRAPARAFRDYQERCPTASLAVRYERQQVSLAGLYGIARLGALAAGARIIDAWLPPGGPRRFILAIENFLRVAAAYQAVTRGGVMLHAAAACREQAAEVFCGHSGSGKTTLAERLERAGFAVLSDDLNTLIPDACGRTLVQRVPYAGLIGRDRPHPAHAPLAGLFRLAPGAAEANGEGGMLETLRPAIAALSLLTCVPFVGGDPFWQDRVLHNLEILAGNVPMARLSLRLTDEPAQVLGWQAA